MTKIEIGYNAETKKPVTLDIQKLVEGRALIQANSGGGKSHLIRQILEKSNSLVQQIIIDHDGEYVTLREKFDNYIVIGKDGDLPINLKTAEMLAVRLLELGANAIIDLSELHKREKIEFVKLFLEATLEVPNEGGLWHDVLYVVDEIHTFAPEKGHGEAISLDAISDLASKGRKRGFALIAATQRPSKFNKDVSAELNIKFIGRCSQDVDMKRAADDLGFFEREKRLSLRKLEHEFYAFGNGLSDDIIKIKSYDNKTKPPKRGQGGNKIIAPSKVKQLLTKLADLDKEADTERKTKADLQNDNRKLRSQVMMLERRPTQAPTIDKVQLEKVANESYQKGINDAEIYYVNQYDLFHKAVAKRFLEIKTLADSCTIPIEVSLKRYLPAKTPPSLVKLAPKPNVEISYNDEITSNVETINSNLNDGVMSILKYLAMFHPDSKSKTELSTLGGFTPRTTRDYLGKLRTKGFIEISGNMVSITTEGMKNAGNYQNLPQEPKEILNLWLPKFNQGIAKVLQLVFDYYPSNYSKEELERQSGFTNRTLRDYLGRLKSNGLIETRGEQIVLSKNFFVAQGMRA